MHHQIKKIPYYQMQEWMLVQVRPQMGQKVQEMLRLERREMGPGLTQVLLQQACSMKIVPVAQLDLALAVIMIGARNKNTMMNRIPWTPLIPRSPFPSYPAIRSSSHRLEFCLVIWKV